VARPSFPCPPILFPSVSPVRELPLEDCPLSRSRLHVKRENGASVHYYVYDSKNSLARNRVDSSGHRPTGPAGHGGPSTHVAQGTMLWLIIPPRIHVLLFHRRLCTRARGHRAEGGPPQVISAAWEGALGQVNRGVFSSMTLIVIDWRNPLTCCPLRRLACAPKGPFLLLEHHSPASLLPLHRYRRDEPAPVVCPLGAMSSPTLSQLAVETSGRWWRLKRHATSSIVKHKCGRGGTFQLSYGARKRNTNAACSSLADRRRTGTVRPGIAIGPTNTGPLNPGPCLTSEQVGLWRGRCLGPCLFLSRLLCLPFDRTDVRRIP